MSLCIHFLWCSLPTMILFCVENENWKLCYPQFQLTLFDLANIFFDKMHFSGTVETTSIAFSIYIQICYWQNCRNLTLNFKFAKVVWWEKGKLLHIRNFLFHIKCSEVSSLSTGDYWPLVFPQWTADPFLFCVLATENIPLSESPLCNVHVSELLKFDIAILATALSMFF